MADIGESRLDAILHSDPFIGEEDATDFRSIHSFSPDETEFTKGGRYQYVMVRFHGFPPQFL
jgi:hypothetical protein